MNNNQTNDSQNKALRVLCSLMAIIFSLIILSVTFYLLLTPDKEMSESENRVLAKKPALTLSSLADGSYMTNFEAWLSDQFPLRDTIIRAKTTIDRLTGKKEENGVYIGQDGFLFEKQSEFQQERVDKTTKAISSFSSSHKKLKQAFLLSPNSTYILSDKLPEYVTQKSQKAQLAEIKKSLSKSSLEWVDCLRVFENESDKTKLFYRTDHHWTTYAAHLSFLQLMKQWGIDTSKTQFSFSAVSNTFQGTLASSSGVSNICDSISICTVKKPKNSSVVNYESSKTKTATYFDKTKLENKNQYEVFLGGNFDKIIISTTAQTDRTLLVFKDSYANCMLPMFEPYFSKIVVIDPRYCNDDISKIMKDYDFTHILFLYNLNTFLEDTSVVKMLGK